MPMVNITWVRTCLRERPTKLAEPGSFLTLLLGMLKSTKLADSVTIHTGVSRQLRVAPNSRSRRQPSVSANTSVPTMVPEPKQQQHDGAYPHQGSAMKKADVNNAKNPLLTPYKLGQFDLKHRVVYAPLTRKSVQATDSYALPAR